MKRAVPLLVLALLCPLAARAQDGKPGAPVRLIAPPPSPAATVAPKAAAAPAGVVATPLGPLDPSWAGALAPDQAALPRDMWLGTSRATVRALLPMIGPAESPGIRALARRLLLSGAAAPVGDDPATGPNLLLLRAQRLAALGAVTGATKLLDAAPGIKSEAAVRLRIELAFAGNDATDGCARVAAGLADRRPTARDVWWDQANIACQLLGGTPDKAALALDLLHDSGAAPDPAFDALVAAAGGQTVSLPTGAARSPLRIALWAAGKRALPANALESADAMTLAAFAGDEAEPAINRLGAAERAALLGAWPAERLGRLYHAASAAEDDPTKVLSDAASGDTPAGRATLFTIAEKPGDAAQRVQALDQFLTASDRHGLYFVAAELAAPIIVAIGPVDAAKGAAAPFIRALIAADRASATEPFARLADPAEIGPLMALMHAIDGGRARPDDKTMAEALAALSLRPSEATPRQVALFLTLASVFRGAVPASDLAAQITPAHPTTMPSAALWLVQQQAQAAHRLGETVLASLVMATPDGHLSGEPIVLRRALSGLRAVGLDAEARSLAREAAIAGGL